MINKKEKSGANLRLLSRGKAKKTNRLLGSGAKHDQPQANLAMELLSSKEEAGEKKPAQYSLLLSLLIFLLALYVVFPTFVKNFDLEKKEDIIHTVAGGYPIKARRMHQQKPRKIVRKEVVPQLYPEIVDVEIETDQEEIYEDSSDDWSSLNIEGDVEGFDFGNGGSGGGPIVNAGEGGDVPYPELLHRVEADYPDAGRKARIDGFVLIQAVINEKGDVVDIKILSQPAVKYGFGKKAVEAVSQWKYKPSMYKGRPVSVRVQFSVDFDLLY